MELITLLPKGPKFQNDLKEILKFVAEDFNSVGIGFILFQNHFKYGFEPQFTYIFLSSDGLSTLGQENLPEFDQPFQLELVVGDLQGLPEIFFTRHPSANDVIISFIRSFIHFPTFCFVA